MFIIPVYKDSVSDNVIGIFTTLSFTLIYIMKNNTTY